MGERQFLGVLSVMEKELGELVAGYGNEEISRLYAEQKTAESNNSLLLRDRYERIAQNCSALLSVVKTLKSETKLSLEQKLDRDVFKLDLEKLEATALESINILSRLKVSVEVSVEVPVVKVQKVETEQSLGLAATFWGAITSAANTLIAAASPKVSPRVSQEIVQSASMEKFSEEKKVSPPPPEKPKTAKKKKKSRLAVIETEKSREEIDAERAATQERARAAEAQANLDHQQMMEMIESNKSEIKKIAEQLAVYQEKPLSEESRQVFKELQRDLQKLGGDIYLAGIPSEFSKKLDAFVERVSLEESLEKYSESIALDAKKDVKAQEKQQDQSSEDKVHSILDAKGPEGLMKELQENEAFREDLLNVHPALIAYASGVVKESKEVSSYLAGLQSEVERRDEEEETTDDKFYRIYLNPKNGPENFARELKENESFREEMIARPDLMQKAVDYVEDDMQTLLDEMEKQPESHDDLLAGIEELHELSLYLESFLPQKETVDPQFEEEMARNEVEVEEFPEGLSPVIPVEDLSKPQPPVQHVAQKSSMADLSETREFFEKTLEQQKTSFLDAIDEQLMDKRAVVARETGLNSLDILTLETAYEHNPSGNNNIAKTAAKKLWDFPDIPGVRAMSDFISTRLMGIPPYQQRVDQLHQQLLSAQSAHDLGEALKNPEKANFAIHVTAELDIGKFEVEDAAKKLFGTLNILENVEQGIASFKQAEEARAKQEPAPTKKRSLKDIKLPSLKRAKGNEGQVYVKLEEEVHEEPRAYDSAKIGPLKAAENIDRLFDSVKDALKHKLMLSKLSKTDKVLSRNEDYAQGDPGEKEQIIKAVGGWSKESKAATSEYFNNYETLVQLRYDLREGRVGDKQHRALEVLSKALERSDFNDNTGHLKSFKAAMDDAVVSPPQERSPAHFGKH